MSTAVAGVMATPRMPIVGEREGERPGISVPLERFLKTSREYPYSWRFGENKDFMSVVGNVRVR